MILIDSAVYVLCLKHVNEHPLGEDVNLQLSSLIHGVLGQGGSIRVDCPHLPIQSVQEECSHERIQLEPLSELVKIEGVLVEDIVLLRMIRH